MAFLDDLQRGLGVIGSAIGGNAQPLNGAIANTLGVPQNTWEQALGQAMRPGYQQAGYSNFMGPLATPGQTLLGVPNNIGSGTGVQGPRQ